jgi:hypothetical protein
MEQRRRPGGRLRVPQLVELRHERAGGVVVHLPERADDAGRAREHERAREAHEAKVQDSAASELTVGVLQGELASLTAARTSFKPGQLVTATLVFSNTGDVAFPGVAWIKVYPADSMTPTAIFSQSLGLPGLLPGQAIAFSAVWNTTGLNTGAYRILGYAQYANLVSNAKEIAVVAPAGVFMPMIRR